MRPKKAIYVELILPLAVGHTFTYSVPEELAEQLSVGKRVTALFGKGRKIRTGIVSSLNSSPREGVKTRDILNVIDEEPIVREFQLAFWFRMADHYMCTPGEVMLAALPAFLLLDSETRIIPLPFSESRLQLPEREQTVLGILDERQVLNISEIAELLALKDPMRKVRRWIESGLVNIEERSLDRYNPPKRKMIGLNESLATDVALNSVFNDLARAPKQTHLLMTFIQMGNPTENSNAKVESKRLIKNSGTNSTVLNQLIKKDILIQTEERKNPETVNASMTIPELTSAQNQALENIRSGFQEKQVCLLQGVTSSGKTEVYLKYIEEAVNSGSQVLYMLPEIALTTQMIERVAERMGDGFRVFHSRLTHRERANIYMDMLHFPEKVKLVVCARSGIFLPFRNLSTIIVDEEHDPSFKQHDPAPRYQARDMAIFLGLIHNAKVLLGSATPSMESLFNAGNGKYAFAELKERYGQIRLPLVHMANVSESRKRGLMKGRFSPELVQAIADRLMKKEQVILFQNRRGYTPIWQCSDCGWVPECDHCDVSLTYHKRDDGLRCHYCGRFYHPVRSCKACSSIKLRMIGFGTEMLEEEIQAMFPDANVGRLDQDTTRKKNSYARIMHQMNDGEIDILVGTQMVTKGLDLEHVTLVGIMNADALIKFPEFRATERAFQLMSQVAGRAGRRNTQGEVIIQTYDPFQPVLELVKNHDTQGSYENELVQRQKYNYPPYSRLLKITLRHKNQQLCERASQHLFNLLSSYFQERAIGPEIPYVSRIRNQHIRNILIKIRKSKHTSERLQVKETIASFHKKEAFRNVRLIIDVDPN